MPVRQKGMEVDQGVARAPPPQHFRVGGAQLHQLLVDQYVGQQHPQPESHGINHHAHFLDYLEREERPCFPPKIRTSTRHCWYH